MRLDHRKRHLASDERAGIVARRSVRDRHRATLRLAWRPLLLLALSLLTCFAIASAFASGPLQRGMILGGGITFTICALAALVVLVSGTAPLIAGGVAEMWTADELRSLRAQGWHLVNHLLLGRYGDYDHVLVGPGGLVLVETKWRAEPRDVAPGDRWFGGALNRVAEDARRLGNWHEVARHGRPTVYAVVAVWGPASRGLQARRESSGVVVLPGPELKRWVLDLERAGLDAPGATAVLAALAAQVAVGDAREGAPVPPSMSRLVRALGVGTVVALLVLLSIGLTIQATGSLLLGVGLLLAAGVASVVAGRRTRWRVETQVAQVLSAALLVLIAVRAIGALV